MPLFPTPIAREPRTLLEKLRRNVRRKYDRLWWRVLIFSIVLDMARERAGRR